MIRATPYYERRNRDEIEREYLRMVAACTPFLPEDVLFDDREGLELCGKAPRKRTIEGKPTKLASLLEAKGIPDGSDTQGKLLAEAKLAEEIVRGYSEDLHAFLYEGASVPGRVNRENLRKLLLLRLPNGQIPEGYRFHEHLSGQAAEHAGRATALKEQVFRYEDKFSKLRKTEGHRSIHELVAMLGVKVCPYCNRQFITTVVAEDRGVRPQLDHFRSKSDYPFLALSINNLVPCCGVCNLLKRDRDVNLVYPYDEDFEDEGYAFGTSIPAEHTVPALEGIPIAEDDFRLSVGRRDPAEPAKDAGRRERIERSIGELRLTELYQSHRDYVAFLYRQRYILTKDLAEDLCSQFPALFDSPKEVEDLFALMHTDRGSWGDRPLAKLTHDILDEIERLYSSGG